MSNRLTGHLTYLTAVIGLKAGCFVLTVLPRRHLYRLSDWVAGRGFYLCRRFRKRSMSNIQDVYGAQMDRSVVNRLAQRCLQSFARACVETGLALSSSDEKLRANIPLVGYENLDAALAKGKGVILLSAHLGNFFLIGCRLTIGGYPASVLVKQPDDERWARLFDSYRLRLRQRTIHTLPRHEALRQLREALRRNEVAIIIADEFRRGAGVRVSLFGKEVIARRGPATLALRTGAAVVPAYMVRQADDSLKLIIEPELELHRSSKGKHAVRESTLRMTRWLEQTVRTYPDQWNWMNLRWWDNSSGGSYRNFLSTEGSATNG